MKSKTSTSQGTDDVDARVGDEIVIRPPTNGVHLDLREFVKFRHTIWQLILRDIKVEFTGLYLNFVWSVARPLLMVFVFTVFRNLSSANTGVAIPYAVYVYSGLVLWFFFVDATNEASSSIRKDAGLIKKIYFPRLVPPIVTIGAKFAELLIAAIPFVALMIWYDLSPNWKIVLLPAVLFQCTLLILGVGTAFAALSLRRRDWEKFLALVLYVGLFASPVIYAPDMIPERLKMVYSVNPMAGALVAFRSCLIADVEFPYQEWIYSAAFSVSALLVGLRMYRSAEAEFLDAL